MTTEGAMQNMSYCRFQNALAALRECSEALAGSDSPDPIADLSQDERKAARQLLKLCSNLAADYYEDWVD